MPGGYVGVDVFFVISGYLITSIISREMENDTFTFARFYERRARRIFPALFAVLAVTLLAGYFLLLPSDYMGALSGALGTLFFVSNLVFWRDMTAGYFAATNSGVNPLLHTWSLAVEEQFYLFFPVLLLLCYRYARHHTVFILTASALVSLTSSVLLMGSKSVAVFFLSPFRAWELLAGSLLALGAVPPIRSRALCEAAAGAGLLAIAIACCVYDSETTFPGLAALAPALGTALIIHAGATGPNLTGRLLQWRPVVYVGLISYSLYLWHWPLIVLTRFATGMVPITPYIPALLAASLALGSLSYHFIEQPFRRDKRVTRQLVFSFSTVYAFVLVLVSVFGLVNRGFEERYTPAVVQFDKARSPQIPFVNCDSKPTCAACIIGSTEGKPTVLLWGDSHLLAWAPALNESLTQLGMRALFVPNSSCPPMLGVDNAIPIYGPLCSEKNLAVKDYLLANPEIKTVIMSAFWSTYFRKNGPLTAQAGEPLVKGTTAAKTALALTIQWLIDNKKQVVLIGPVPVYDTSVPLGLALEQANGRKFKRSSMVAQRQKNASFFEVVESAQRGDEASVRLLDPILWLCAPDCMVMKDGVSLYRDAGHLSVAGAMALEPDLRQGLRAPAMHLIRIRNL